MTTMRNVLGLVENNPATTNMQRQNSSLIHNRKRVLVDEFLSSADEQIKELQLDDHAIEAIFDCLEHPERDLELFRSITKRLYEIYRSQDERLRLVTLIFIPTLIAIYIRFHHANSCCYQDEETDVNGEDCQDDYQKTDHLNPNSSIAVLLLFVYNSEIIQQKTGELKTIDIRLISLAKPSIYHESNNTAAVHATIPTEQALAKINSTNESKIKIFGPYHEVEKLNTGNQQSVFTVLLKIYNQHLQQVGYYSLQSMCKLYEALLRQGTNNLGDLKQQIKSIIDGNDFSGSSKITPQVLQIPFSSEFLTEMMRAAYFCYYNELEDLALDLIEEIARRATYKFYADVILMVNAFKNTQAIINRDREERAAKMKKMNQSEISLNAAATAPINTVTAALAARKAAITNASFKTRKLPDDIPIVATTPNATPDAQYANAVRLAKQAARNAGQNPQSTTGTKVQPHHQNGRSPAVAFKSLDSINEESPTATSSPGSSQNVVRVPNSNKANNAVTQQQQVNPKKKGVMNLFKELKDKPKKSSKNSRTVETNGKVVNNQESIPMKKLEKLKKFIDDDDNGESDDDDSSQTSTRLDDVDRANEPENGDDDDDDYKSLPEELLLITSDRDGDEQRIKPCTGTDSGSCNLSANTGSSDRGRSSSGESGVALLSGASNNQTTTPPLSSSNNHPVIKTLSDSSSFHHHHPAKSVKKMSIHNSIN